MVCDVAIDGYTIGEVLNQLKEDFEDITISKIRFLESEGLVSPGRTKSGYRQFSDDDVDRLRFILTAQREHYLPLKVIRDQLEKLDAGEVPAGGTVGDDPATDAQPQLRGAHESEEDSDVDAAPAVGETGETGEVGVPSAGERTDGMGGQRAVDIARLLESAMDSDETSLEDQPAHVTLSLRELCDATGLDPSDVRALRDFGILGERGDEGAPFGGDDLLAARAARELLQLGLEPRHLRMYRQFVDRELALFEQLINPLLRQRNPEARRQATQQLERLSSLTGRMKRSLLTRVLRGYVHRT